MKKKGMVVVLAVLALCFIAVINASLKEESARNQDSASIESINNSESQIIKQEEKSNKPKTEKSQVKSDSTNNKVDLKSNAQPTSGKSKKDSNEAVKETAPNTKGSSENNKTVEQEQTHIHLWEPIYSYTTVNDYGNKIVEICRGCGADITSWSREEWQAHSDTHMDKGEESGFYEKEVKVIIGTHKVKQLVGYKCSCGATKNK